MREQLSPDHYIMDWPMPNGAIQRTLLAAIDASVVFKVIAVLLVAALLHSLIFKPQKRQIFPAWATIEIAATAYIISKGSLSKRI